MMQYLLGEGNESRYKVSKGSEDNHDNNKRKISKDTR